MMTTSPSAIEPFTKSLITTYHDKHMLEVICPHEMLKIAKMRFLDFTRLDSLKKTVNFRLMCAIFWETTSFGDTPHFLE